MINRLLIFGGIISIFIGNIQAQDTLSTLTKRWKTLSIINQSGNSVKPVTSNDYLEFSKNYFEYELKNIPLHSKGLWKFKNGDLIFSYFSKDFTKTVDSVIFENRRFSSRLKFYKNGKVIGTKDKDSLYSIGHQRTYHITKLNNDTLIFSENGIDFIYSNPTKKTTIIPANEESWFISLLRGLLGLATLITIGFLFSTNRKAIRWKTILSGLSFQIIIAFLVMKVPEVEFFFEIVGKIFIKILNFTEVGSEFLFGGLVDPNSYGFIFAFQILPTIVFFSALSSVLYYYGIIQKVVFGMAWLLKKALHLSGAESLSTAGNIFLGQTESPLLIKGYLGKMNRSELLLIMVGGMATIAGGVLAIYIKFLGGEDPVGQMLFAKHLITASVMAAPGAVVAAKLLLPQTEKIETDVDLPKSQFGTNVLQAISNGTTEGVKLAVNVAAMLLVFIAFIALINYVFSKVGGWTHLNPLITDLTSGQYKELNLQFILGYTLSPLTWLIGVNGHDITLVGQLLGEKIILNELIGYKSLKEYMDMGLFSSEKSVIIATYILCGFANLGSIGIQLGGIGALVPEKRKMLSELGIRALIGGTIASLLSATIIGTIMSF